MRVIIDTNFLIAVLDELDEHHKKAVNLWTKIEKAYVPLVVFHELAFLVIKKKIKRGLRLVKDLILSEKIIPVEVSVSDVLFACEHAKSFDDYNDYIILSIALRMGLDLLTFDEKLRKEFERIIEK